MANTRSSDRRARHTSRDATGSQTGKKKRPKKKQLVRDENPKNPTDPRKPPSITEWNYIIPEDLWFPGKITINSTKNVLSNFTSKFNEHQRAILADTCFAFFMDCAEIVVQPQLIHYLLLREVKQPNTNEMWFKVANRYLRFSLCEFCLVTGLRYHGKDVRRRLDKVPSRIKETYFGHLKLVTNEDVRDVFLDVSGVDDNDVVKLGILYLITSYLFSTSYKKVVEHYLFALVEDFDAMGMFPWGKDLFEMSMKSLKEGLGRRNPHYRLKGFLVAFQVWIYESIPSLNGPVTNKIGNRHPRMLNWMSNKHPCAVKLDEDVFSYSDLDVHDIVPSKLEMVAPYMRGVQYTKPRQPHIKADVRSKVSGHAGTSTTAESDKPRTRLLMITDGRKGHSSDVDDEDDDDFIDPPPKRHKRSPCFQTPIQDHTTPQKSPTEPHVHNVNTPMEPHATHEQDPSHPQVSGNLRMEISELQKKNTALTKQVNHIKSQFSSFKVDGNDKMNQIIRMQGDIKSDMADIRSQMAFLSDSVNVLISSTMDAILKKFNDKNEGISAGFAEESTKVTNIEQTGSKKGKEKMVEADEFENPYFPPTPSFDLGIGTPQMTSSLVNMCDVFNAEYDQQQVDDAIAGVVRQTESNYQPDMMKTKDLEQEGSPPSAPTSGLPVKRAPRPARILQSPFVTGAGKQCKHSEDIVVFDKHDKPADEADLVAFQNWFNRGYKPRNKKKFNNRDDVIRPPFIIGSITIGSKTWWHELICPESSLSNTHMDICFYYLRQFAIKSQHARLCATTTDTLFQAKIKNIFPHFMKQPDLVFSDSYIVEVSMGSRLEYSRPWAEVDYVFMPILPTNRAHWMLGCLDIRRHKLYIFQSSLKTYRENMVLAGIKPFARVIPHLMVGLGIWKRSPSNPDEDPTNLTVLIADNMPQQQNGHDCGIFVIKYAEYMVHNDMKAMPMTFDASRARLDIATLLFKHKEIKKPTKMVKPMGDSIVLE